MGDQMTEVRSLSLMGIREKFDAWWNGYASPSLSGLNEYKRSFLHWWNGEVVSEENARWALQAPSPERTADAPHSGRQDVSARLVVSQALWGEGNLTPGPAEFITNHMLLLRLTPEMSMLDLGAGLGGPSRAISAAFGIWVTALEWEAEIAATGMEQSVMHGMGRKVPVTHFDPGDVPNQARKIDCFFSKDTLHLIQEKKQLLLAVRGAFKKHGQFCIMDYVITSQGENSPRIAAWNAAQEQVSHFWSKEQYAAAITGMKLELRVTEDMTEQYCKMIADGFRQLTNKISQLLSSETDPDGQSRLRRALAFESNFWAARLEAMQAGDIAVIRFSGNTPQ